MNLLETAIEITPTEAVETATTFATFIQSVGLPIGIVALLCAVGWMWYRKKAKAAKNVAAPLLAIGLLTLSGCGLFESTNKSWIEADRATFDLVGPEYRAYVEADPALNTMQKGVRTSAVDTWELRLKANEKAGK